MCGDALVHAVAGEGSVHGRRLIVAAGGPVKVFGIDEPPHLELYGAHGQLLAERFGDALHGGRVRLRMYDFEDLPGKMLGQRLAAGMAAWGLFRALVGDRLRRHHHGLRRLRRLRRREQGALQRVHGIESSLAAGAEHHPLQIAHVREHLLVPGLERLVSLEQFVVCLLGDHLL